MKAHPKQADRLLRKQLFHSQPADKEELHLWTQTHFGVNLTKEAVCPHHDSQLDYLWHATQNRDKDSYLLANRSGGKTQCAAIGTDHNSEFYAPIHTLFVGGCLHPSSPVITSSGFKPIIEVRRGDKSFDGRSWQNIVGITSRPPRGYLKLSFIGFPPLGLTPDHPLLAIRGINCPLSSIGYISPRVCSDGVSCAYHRRRFHCKGRGIVEEVPAQELNVGDALIFPLSYMNASNGAKPICSSLIHGILFGSHTRAEKGLLTIYKRYSISREYDRWVLDRIRDIIAEEMNARPIRQESAGESFALRYDIEFFKGYHLGTDLPYDFFLWPEGDKHSFLKGALSGTRYTICNAPTYLNAFATTRNTSFAYNLFVLTAAARPKLDLNNEYSRLIFADSSIPMLNEVPQKFSSLKSLHHRAGTQAVLDLDGWGKVLATRIKSIEICEPSVPFIDIQVEGGERFLTLQGVVHNSELQASHMYAYSKKPYDKDRDGIASDETLAVGIRELALRNGSKIRIIPSSEKAAGGFHVDEIKLDQIDDMDTGVFDTLQFDIDMSSEGHTPVSMLGTWDKLGGLYDQVLQKARESGAKIWQWCLLDVIEPCKDRMCSICELSDCCGGIAKDKKEGFLKIEKAINVRKRLLTQSRWAVQMLLQKPRPLEAIIPKFHDTIPFVQRIGYNPVLPTHRGFDWGARGNFASVWLQFDEYKDRVFVIAEIGSKPRTGAIECAERVMAYEGRKGIRNIASSYGDPSGASWIRDFQIMGIPVLTYYVSKESRLGILTNLLEIRSDGLPGIIISTECKQLRDQLLMYDIRCFEKRSGAPRDDFVDALLYPLASLNTRLKLKSDSPEGTIGIKRSQEAARIAKFSPEVERLLEVSRGKTDFTRLLP